jgi:hypothetical protein
VPGTYTVRLTTGGKSQTATFEYMKDPRVSTTGPDYAEQFAFLMKVRDKVSEIHNAVNTIRDVRSQTDALVKRLEDHPSKNAVKDSAKQINERLKTIEEALIQVKIKSSQDALNYPIRLNDKIATLSGVAGSADTRPTKQTLDAYTELTAAADPLLDRYEAIIDAELDGFNAYVRSLDVPAVTPKPPEEPK